MKRLTILVGPSCSGKSTYQKNHLSDIFCISEDEVMSQLDSGQPCSSLELHQKARIQSFRLILEAFQQGKTHIVYDSTNLTPARRQEIYHYFQKQDIAFDIVQSKASFQTLYHQWEKRGKDIDVASLLYYASIFIPASFKEHLFQNMSFFGDESQQVQELENFLKQSERTQEDLKKVIHEQKELQVIGELFQSTGQDIADIILYQIFLQETPSPEYIFFCLFSVFQFFYDYERLHSEREYNLSWEEYKNNIFTYMLLPKIQALGLSKEIFFEYYESL